MRNGLVIASALLAASCNAAPEQATEQPEASGAASAESAIDRTGASNALANEAVSPSNYAILIATLDLFEIASGKLAQKNGQTAATREFAKMMVDDHTASLRDLKAAVERSDVNVLLPTRLDAQQQGLLDRLERASAAEFDREYMNQQVDGHRIALALHQDYQAAADDRNLLAFSQKVLPVIQAHYDRLEEDRVARNRTSTVPAKQ